MARMVEDQEQGMVEAASPDTSGAAKDLLERGFTPEQVEEVSKKLPANETSTNSLVKAMREDKKTSRKFPLSGQAPADLDLASVFSGGQGLDLEEMFAEVRAPFQYSRPAQKETAALVAPLTGTSPDEAMKLLDEDQSLVSEAYRELQSKNTLTVQAKTEKRIQLSQTPEETSLALADMANELGRTLDLGDLRAASVTSTLPEWRKDTATGHIRQNLAIAEEISKASAQVWKEAPYADLFKDLGQLVLPFTGYAEEEIVKWSDDTASKIRQLKQTNNRQEARILVDQIVDALKDTQTPLIERNNTLLTLQSLDSLAEEFRNGAYGYVDDIVTEEEVSKGVETAVFGAVEATGIGGLVDAIKVIGKRILPTKQAVDGTMVVRPEFKEGDFIPKVDGTDIAPTGGKVQLEDNAVYLFSREGSSTLDTQAIENGLPIRQSYSDRGVKNTVEEANLTPEQASDRLMPSMEEYFARTLPNTEPNLTELNELNLINTELGNIKGHAAQKLQRDIGEAGVVQTSNIALRSNDDPTSLGDFIIHIGDPDGSWFSTREAAESVRAKMFGADSEIVEVQGKYAVRVERRHTFNPKEDVTDKPEEIKKARALSDSLYQVGLLDPMRALGEDFMGAASAVLDVNRSRLTKLAGDFQKATKAWSHKKQQRLGKLMQVAEEIGVEGKVLTRRDAEAQLPSLSKRQMDDVWESYQQIQEITDEIYTITDKRFRTTLETGGWKYGEFGEETDFIRKARADEVDPKETIFDPEQNRLLTQEEASELLDGSRSIVKSMNARLGPDGKEHDLLLISNTKTRDLPAGPLLNKREGYVPRYYTETGWIIREAGERTRNGVTKPSSRVTHIVRSKKEAKAAKARAIQRKIEEMGLTDPSDIEAMTAKLNQELKISRSRENGERELIWGNDNDVSFGFGAGNSKAKGERLIGSEGNPAPVLDPVGAISRRINSISKDLNHPVIASLQSRFIKKFGEYLKDGARTSWNNNLEAMLARTDELTPEIKRAMTSYHSYVNNLRGEASASALAYVDRVIDSFLGDLSFSGGTPLQNGVAWMKRNAAMVFIIGRPLFQIPTNMMQAWTIFTRGAIKNNMSSLRGMAATPFVIAARAVGESDPYGLAKLLKIPESEVKPLMDFLFEESGLVKGADFVDDILSMATDDLVSNPGSLAGFYARKYLKPASLISPALKVSSAAQTKSLQLLNMYAFMSEVSNAVHALGKQGKKFKMDSRTKEILLRQTRKLTQTQNRTNEFTYQSSKGMRGMIFQFQQHVQKMFLDLVVEPVAVSTLPSKVTNNIKNRNPFAENRQVAVGMTMFNLMLFGTAGLMGGGASRQMGNELIEEFPELASDPEFQAAYDMLRGGTINTFINGFSDRVTPAAYIDTLSQMFSDDQSALELLMGPAGSYTNSVIDLGKNLLTLSTNGEIETEEAFAAALRETSSLFASAKDVERAYIAYNFGTLPYSRNLSGTMHVNNLEAIASAFSVTPEHILDYYAETEERGGFGGKETGSFERINELFVRQMNRELTELQASGDYSILNAIPIRQKWVKIAKAAHGNKVVELNKVEEFFKARTLTPGTEDFDKFVQPYIYDHDLNETVENLERLKNTTDNPRLKEFIDNQLFFRKMFLSFEEEE